MKKTYLIIVAATTLLMIACNKNKDNMSNTEKSQFITVSQEIGVEDLTLQLKEAIEAKGFKIIADIDHAKGAQKVDLELRPTRTLIFGNPMGGTKLMQSNQQIGIDLPLKLLVWEDESGKTNVSYFDGSALTARYEITEPQAVIEKVNGALAGLSKKSEQTEALKSVAINNKMIAKKSSLSAEETFDKLKDIILSKGLTVMAEVPHDKAAASVDLELRPTRLIIFGNPKVGTLLMQSNQEIGLDLPLKMLVHENENGEVYISYFDASFLAERYGISDKSEVIAKVNGALDGISSAAVSE